MRRLKLNLAKEGLETNLIDDPNAVLPNQAGYSDREIRNDAYEKGLRLGRDN
jgi:hypothetical protein